jgi:hypothetical protein
MRLARRWCTLGAVLAGSSIGCSQRLHDRVKAVDETFASFPKWERVAGTAPAGVDLFDLWMREDGSEGWAVGTKNTILHYMGGKWHADTLNAPLGTQWTSIAFSESARIGYAVGSGGQIAHYRGDDHWELLHPVLADSLTSIWLDRGGLQGYVAGRGGVLLKLENGTWVSKRLNPPPASGDFADVVANDDQVWVREEERRRVTEYTRDTHDRVRLIEGFGAFSLWQQPNSGAIFVVGVQQVYNGKKWVAKDGSGYMVRRFDGERSTTLVDTIIHAPWTAWMDSSATCGIGAGVIAGRDRDWPLSMFFTPSRTIFFENPDSVSIKSVWVNSACSAGWGVGSGGFVGRWSRDSWKVGPLTWPEGDIQKLEGHFELAIDTLYRNTTLDSIRLIGENHPLKLDSLEHFAASTTADGVDFTFSPVARFLAKRTLQGQRVKLRLFLTFRTPADTFRVAYDKENQFVLEPGNLWDRLPSWAKGTIYVFGIVCGLILARIPVLRKRLWPTPFTPPAKRSSTAMHPPKAYIAYKWEGPKHNEWVKRFAGDLRARGIDAHLDEWEVRYGDSFTDYMTSKIAGAGYFLFIMTPASVAAAEAPGKDGGAVKFEIQMATARRTAGEDMKIIGIYRAGDSTPMHVRDHRYVDFRNDKEYEKNLGKLVDQLLGMSEKPDVRGA